MTPLTARNKLKPANNTPPRPFRKKPTICYLKRNKDFPALLFFHPHNTQNFTSFRRQRDKNSAKSPTDMKPTTQNNKSKNPTSEKNSKTEEKSKARDITCDFGFYYKQTEATE